MRIHYNIQYNCNCFCNPFRLVSFLSLVAFHCFPQSKFLFECTNWDSASHKPTKQPIFPYAPSIDSDGTLLFSFSKSFPCVSSARISTLSDTTIAPVYSAQSRPRGPKPHHVACACVKAKIATSSRFSGARVTHLERASTQNTPGRDQV